MKILHISPSYKPASVYGGPIRSVSLLCEMLSRTAISIQLLTTTANGDQELPAQRKRVNGVDVLYFKRFTKDHTHLSPGLLYHLYQQIRKNNQQIEPRQLIVHIHSWWNTVALFSCLIAKCFNIPVILSPRGMVGNYTFKNRNHFLKKVIHHTIGLCLLKYCHIHATSKQEAQDILAVFKPKQLTVIPNLVSFNQYEHQKNTSERVFKLLFLSRIEQKKGLELLFKALEHLSINWSLSIVGYGKQEYMIQLKSLLQEYTFQHRVTWHNVVADEAKYCVFAKHDLFILPSYNENFANVVLECLSAGTPVAISNEVGLADYVIKNKLGWVFKLSPIDMAKTLNLAYRSNDERKRIQVNAPRTVRTDFALNKITAQYLELYAKTLQP